jgi:ATP-dependent Clp protease ATP-binding subunit ClpC
VFERFTEPARQVGVLAQDEARLLGHGFVGTEHLLLGLLREEAGVAARVLASLEVTLDEVRSRVSEIVAGGEAGATTGQIPFTPRAKNVLELALREALGLGHNYIGTEHVLLGLVREQDGVAARILVDLGADAEKVRGEVLGALSGMAASGMSASDAPRVTRRPRRPAPRFVYRVERRARAAGIEEAWLNGLGAEGWELVATTTEDDELVLVFKRRQP